jgi:hypothetical protein
VSELEARPAGLSRPARRSVASGRTFRPPADAPPREIALGVVRRIVHLSYAPFQVSAVVARLRGSR